MEVFKKVKTIEERDNKIEPVHQHLICNDDSELVALILAGTEVEQPVIESAGPLSKAQLAAGKACGK